jgi:glycosyltransferase involved in cell wall biosynthesis
MGFRNDVRDIMRMSEIFILPSRFEGLPMVLLEAMSQGMACIAYDCKTGPSDIINPEYENGILIQDQNIELMQKGLQSLILNETARRELGVKAMKSLDHFTIENIIIKWQKVFDEILIK